MFEDDAPNQPASRAPSSKDVAGEDFLFHLYRGSELLQDNRVHEAKQELEHALSLQPRDAKGQDLLAIVYFRLGLYPRAIQIYEGLIVLHPHAATPRINLALCYLKTGQASAARTELERVLELSPNHSRAWGYLGLSFQRLGDYERACQAFLAGGHDAMARRLSDLSAEDAGSSSPDRALVGHAASAAFDQLDRPADQAPRAEPFRTDSDSVERRPSGTWEAVEPGREPAEVRRGVAILSPSIVPSLAPSESLLPPLPARPLDDPHDRAPDISSDTPIPPPPAPPRFDAALGPVSSRPRSIPPSLPSFSGSTALVLPDQPETFARRLLLVFPRHHSAALHPSGFVLLQSASSLVARFDMVRALAFPSGFTTTLSNRHARGRDLDEPLGGTASPLFRIEGTGNLVLGPSMGTKLSVISVAHESLFIRESALVAMESWVAHENGKLAGGDGDSIAMVHLRGHASDPGASPSAVKQGKSVVLALPQNVSSIEVVNGHALLLRAHSILGWIGQISPHALAPSEAPGKMRGFISLSGEGMVLIDAR